ncbi:MAG TPA: hypothetical protein VN879_18140 [Candidatus Acidoferrales bacterium]|jgi:hypothetical protein|nr:hypothetical protein [Candidatus Acidoferrales bacterium]
MSADQIMEPDGAPTALESALLVSFQLLKPKMFAAGPLPALLTKPAAIITSTEANKAILNRRTKNLLLTSPGRKHEVQDAVKTRQNSSFRVAALPGNAGFSAWPNFNPLHC